MKKVILLAAAAILSAGIACAQDFKQATELAKQANEALVNGNGTAALEGFKAALAQAVTCTEDGAAELVSSCQKGINIANLAIANDLIKASELEKAIDKLKETIQSATETADDEIIQKAGEKKTQVHMALANNYIKAGKANKDAVAYQSALANVDEVLAAEPANGRAYLLKGQIHNALSQKNEAISAFEKAIENGEEKQAKAQLSNIYLKIAQAYNKSKDYNAAIAAAIKSNEYKENANAYKIGGIAANSAKNAKQAVEFLGKYLELKPNAADAEQIKQVITGLKATLK